MTDDDFRRSIAASPWDRSLRLVYADWLEERDDPRAAFLREDAELVERLTARPISFEKAVPHLFAWESRSHDFSTGWVSEIAIPCDLWIMQVPKRVKPRMAQALGGSSGLNLRWALDRLDRLPRCVLSQTSVGQICRWLRSAGADVRVMVERKGLGKLKLRIDRCQGPGDARG